MERVDIVESPRKRIKTDSAPSGGDVVPSSDTTTKANGEDAQTLKEVEVGITEYVSRENEGFSGILKKRYVMFLSKILRAQTDVDRYTDFLVNEILTTGEVLHLRNIAAPEQQKEQTKDENKTAESTTADKDTAQKPEDEANATEQNADATPEFQLSDEDRNLLDSFFGPEVTRKIVSLHRRAASSNGRPSELGKISTIIISDRDQRVQVHQAIRRIFNSQLESSTDNEGMLWISAAPNRDKRNKKGGRGGNGRNGGGRINWQELGGSYLHFTIHKENKDTMEVISFMARTLKMNAKAFQFAGTKDRRGVTVQRACAHRVLAERLAGLNRTLRNARLGDFEYREHGLELGDLNGNEFVVTLRESEIPELGLKEDRETAMSKANEMVGSALRNLRERGYFNYYGLQRFGTFSTRTDTVGVKMLQGDFKGACESILHYPPHILAAAQDSENKALISTDDKARAEAIHLFQSTGKSNEALDKLPRKFSAETNLIRHLSRSKNDFIGALQLIPRNLRLMYVHAYQSLVWNFAVSERWRLYGDKVVEGDLVLIHEHLDKNNTASTATAETTVDTDGEVIITPKASDAAHSKDDQFTRARPLSAPEAASGQYTVFDVVLPLPGFDVLYPANQMTEFYKSFMGSEQGGKLDPFDMRRKWKDVSLSGSYRKVVSRMGEEFSFDVRLYARDDEQFVRTDLEAVEAKSAASAEGEEKGENEGKGEGENEANKLAIIVKFQLGLSQYATMALRELMKGKVKAYTPDFGGGR